MSTTPMSLAQFGQTIKAKHPEYSDLADEDVGQKVLAKYPQYSDMVQQPKVSQQVLDTLRKNINSPAGGAGYSAFNKTGILDNLATAGKNAMGIVAGLGQAMEAPSNFGASASSLAQGVTSGIAATPANASIPEKMAMAVGPAVGINTPALSSAARNRDLGAAMAEAGPTLAASLAPAAIRGIQARSAQTIPSPTEPQARTIMKSIGPREMDMNPLQDAIEKQHGNIAQFAADNKMPMNSRMDYVNAARAFAETQKNFYESNVLNPIADETVNAPQNFKGYTTGEANNRTTIGSLEQRLRDINTEQNSIHNKATGAMTAEALAKDSELTAEAAATRKALYSEIAKRTNMTPEQIQQIREQFGAPHTIADLTERAVNREVAMDTRTSRGTTTVPEGRQGMVNLMINRLRGGPVAIGDRQFLAALRQAQMAPSPAVQPQIVPQQPSPYQSAWGDTSGSPVPSIMDQSAAPTTGVDAIRQALASRGNKASVRNGAMVTASEQLANRLAARRMMQQAKY